MGSKSDWTPQISPSDFFIFLALCSRGFVWVTSSGAWNCYAGMCSSGLKNLQWLWLPHCLEMSFLCFWLPSDSLSDCRIPFRSSSHTGQVDDEVLKRQCESETEAIVTQEVQDGSTIVSTKDSTVWLGRRVRKCKTFGMQHMTVGYVCIYIYLCRDVGVWSCSGNSFVLSPSTSNCITWTCGSMHLKCKFFRLRTMIDLLTHWTIPKVPKPPHSSA